MRRQLSEMVTELAHAFGDEKGEKGPVGTPLYMSPEQTYGHATPASDCWGFGVLVCELLTGHTPWGAAANNPLLFMCKLAKDPSEGGPVPVMPDGSGSVSGSCTGVPEDIKGIAMSCLVRDPDKRPTAAQLLAHPYMMQ
eukprot:gene47851-5908_t